MKSSSSSIATRSCAGYTLVCPRQHVERVIGDLSEDAYLRLQRWVYRVGQAVQQVVPTERLYVLSLGSQQGNRHVHWHLAPLPPDVPLQEQQLAALSFTRGLLPVPPAQMAELAEQIRACLVVPGRGTTAERTPPGDR